jgi:hypothetical protein
MPRRPAKQPWLAEGVSRSTWYRRRSETPAPSRASLIHRLNLLKSEAHSDRYLCEFDFKYNYRSALGYTDAERADALLRSSKGKRLLYRQLTKLMTLKQKARAFLRWRKRKATKDG